MRKHLVAIVLGALLVPVLGGAAYAASHSISNRPAPQVVIPTSAKVSTGHDAGDDKGVDPTSPTTVDDHGDDPAGHDAGDDKGVDPTSPTTVDDHGDDPAGHDAGDDKGVDPTSPTTVDDHGGSVDDSGHGGSDG